jgi:O-antigen ligase
VSPSATLDQPAQQGSALRDHDGMRAGLTPRNPRSTSTRRRSDDWPHTRRVLPWMIAAFIAMLWLVPFDSISLTVSLPFDLHLDRIVLPFILLAWGLVFAADRRGTLRLRLTPIHVAIGAFVLICLFSVIVNAPALNASLELKDTIKHLLLLASYVAFFFVIASSVRPGEVRPFLTYSLGLAVVCGVGTLVEFRLHYNAFYALSAQLLPSGLFNVGAAYSSGQVDEIGRVVILGPGEVGLEVASMLAMAVPLALVGTMQATRRGARFLYGAAAAVVLAAGLGTDEKTSLVAPAVAVLALICFRPRQIKRLIPLFLVMIVAAHVLAPGAIGSVAQQFGSGRLTAVGTTQHRQDGYDAIRPLVWSHPALGMGYGSYNGVLNRILDNQMLDNLIETGILGALAYVMMPVVVIVTAVPLIRNRRRDGSRDALGASVAAIVFLTVSVLFDAMSFPHVPYIFLTSAGLIAVLWQFNREQDALGLTQSAQNPHSPGRIPLQG